MKKLLAISVVSILCGGLSLSAQEPLRAEKPSVEREFQWKLLFETNAVMISADPEVPVGFVKSTIDGLQDAGHLKFSIKTTTPGQIFPPREVRWMQIKVKNEVAEIDVDPELAAQNLISVIEHLDENGVKLVKFAPPQKR
jgi:biopolymer transport protein ExbD